MTTEHHTSRLTFAGITTATVLAWYALPDVVRSRTLRGVIKAGLLGVTAAGVAQIPAVFPEARQVAARADLARADLPASTLAALAVGATAAVTAATVWGEKLVFARGERRRAAGARWAHTPAAAVLALASGAAALVDWTPLADAVSKR
jgi:hypothetical protein